MGIGIALLPQGRDMKLLRRQFLELTGGVVAAAAFPPFAAADDYPTRPVRIIAGFAAGGGVDITARLIGQWLADRLGQSFVVETGREPAATSAPRPSSTRPPTDIRFCLP